VTRAFPLLVTFALAFAGGCKKDDTSAPQGQPAKTTPAASAPSGGVASASAAPSGALEVVGKRVDIDVGEHGFTPTEVDVKKGEATTLVFTRTSNSTCAFEVVFPDLNVTKDLPLNRPVAVVVPTDESRTLAFQCGMGMYKSKVVVQ
jgi:Cupredoxin-like domain